MKTLLTINYLVTLVILFAVATLFFWANPLVIPFNIVGAVMCWAATCKAIDDIEEETV